MNGTVKTFLPEKGYGFILGDDKKDYFFHVNNLQKRSDSENIGEGSILCFEQKATPKGYEAFDVILADPTALLYEAPEEIMLVKKGKTLPRGWEVIVSSEWSVEARDEDMEEVYYVLRENAREVGANALLDVTYNKEKEEDGNYKYTVHYLKGKLAMVGKKSTKGELARNDLIIDLNGIAEEMFDELYERSRPKKKSFWFAAVLGLIIGIGVGYFFKSEIALIIGTILGYLFFSGEGGGDPDILFLNPPDFNPEDAYASDDTSVQS